MSVSTAYNIIPVHQHYCIINPWLQHLPWHGVGPFPRAVIPAWRRGALFSFLIPRLGVSPCYPSGSCYCIFGFVDSYALQDHLLSPRFPGRLLVPLHRQHFRNPHVRGHATTHEFVRQNPRLTTGILNTEQQSGQIFKFQRSSLQRFFSWCGQWDILVSRVNVFFFFECRNRLMAD